MISPVRKVILLSGLPGSGKTTRAGQLIADFVRQQGHRAITYSYSTDDFWEQGGRYVFDIRRVREANNWAFARFVTTLQAHPSSAEGNVLVCVHNTFITNMDLAPYLSAAQAFGFEVEIQRLIVPLEVALMRNIHHVPEQSIRRWARTMEQPPPFWKYTAIPATGLLVFFSGQRELNAAISF